MKWLLALFAVLVLLTACGPLVTQSVQIGAPTGFGDPASKPVSRKNGVSDKQLMRMHNLLSSVEKRVSSLTDKIKDVFPLDIIKYE